MKLQMINENEYFYLIHNSVIEIENRVKYKNENRNFAIFLFFIFIVLIFPIGIIVWGLIMVDFFDIAGWCFFIFFGAAEVILFRGVVGNYLLSKYPEQFFWRYFIEKKFELKFVSTIEEDGKEYVVHGFVNEKCILSTCAFMLLKIRKDEHETAMELMRGGRYEIAEDGEGNKKVVVNGGEIREVDNETLLVMKLIKTIYDLYGEDINELWAKREKYRKALENELS